jgi:hypothetical protein
MTDPLTSKELLPCPFDGGEAKGRWCGGVYIIECSVCGVSQGDGGAEMDHALAAAARWNRRAPETVSTPVGQESWRLALPIITVQMLGDYGQEGFFEKTDQPVKGVAGVSWSQAAVDFACMLQEQLQKRLSPKASEPVKREWRFDRYRNGRLMAEGVTVHTVTEAEAWEKAESLKRQFQSPTDELRLSQSEGEVRK